MKTVINSQQVAHLWAHQSQSHAKGYGSTSFVGDTLYSYAAKIGRVMKVRGKLIALFVDTSWSVTTSKHQSYMRRAAHHLQCFNIADIGDCPNNEANSKPPSHKKNLEHYKEKIDNLIARLPRARLKHNILSIVQQLILEAVAYCQLFGLSAKRFELDLTDAEADAVESAKKQAAADRLRLERAEVRRQEAIANDANVLADWIAGKSDIRPRFQRTHFARVQGDEIVTTLGARVPVADAKKALPVVKRIVVAETPWQSNGATIKLGDFQIDRIDADGTMRAGCHLLTGDEVKRVIRILEGKVRVG